MEEPENEVTSEKPKPSRLKRILQGILIACIVLFVLLPATLYIPVVQDFVCRMVVSYLNKSSEDLEYQVGKVRIGFPLQLKVEDVSVLKRKDGKALVHVGLLQTGLDDIPIHQPYFVLNRLKVKDVVLGMDSLTESFGMVGTLNELNAERIKIDPASYQFRIEDIFIQDPDILLYKGPSPPDTIEEESKPWDVLVQRIAIKDGSLGLDMSDVSLTDAMTGISQSPYLDYNHLSVTGISLEAEQVTYAPDLIRADVNVLKAKDQNCGLEVTGLAARFLMQEDLIDLTDVDLRLASDDYLKGDARLDLGLFDQAPFASDSGVPPSKPAVSGPNAVPSLTANLSLSIDSANLIRIAAPYLDALQANWVNAQARLDLDGRMTPDSLDLRHLALVIPGHIDLEVEGAGESIFDNNLRNAALTARGTMKNADFLLSSFVASCKDRSYCLPDDLELDLEATQRGEAFTARVDMLQEGRNVLVGEAKYDFGTEAYHVNANTMALNVSEFVPAVVADGLTARLKADGRHFRFPGRYTRVEANLVLDSLLYLDPDGTPDRLEGVSANVSLIGGNYTADILSLHPYLQLGTHLDGVYTRDSVSARGFIDMPLADLAHLPYGYSQPERGVMGFRSLVSGSYNWKDIAQLDLRIDSLSYFDSDIHTRFDSIIVDVDSQPGLLSAEVSGGDARLSAKMDRSVLELPAVLDSILREVDRQKKNSTFDFAPIRQTLPTMRVDLHMARQNPFYQALQMQLGYSFQSADLTLRNSDELNLDGQVISLYDQTGSIDFDTLSVALKPYDQPQTYQYALHATHIDPHAEDTYDAHCSGRLMTDSVTVDLSYIDGNYLTLYDVNTSLALRHDTLTLHFEDDPMLYEQQFKVNKDNYFSVMNFLNPEAHNLNTHARMKLEGPRNLQLSLYTRPYPNQPLGNQLLLLMKNLDIAYATNVMEWDGDAGGRADLSAAVSIFPDSITAHFRSGIRSFHFGEYQADTLAYVGQFSMVGNDKDLDGVLTVDSIVKLRLNACLSDSINVRARIDELPLPLVNAFLPTDMQLFGCTSGHLIMLGRDMDHAKVNASLSMIDAGLVYTDLDARLHFSDDSLLLVDNKLRLDDYSIYCANRNPVTLNGLVDLSKNVTNPGIRLDIVGQNVNLIDNQELRLKDQYIYGRLPITPNIKVRGTLENLSVTGSLHVLSGTDLDYFLTDDPLQSSSQVDQLVDFVNFRQMDRRLQAGDGAHRPPKHDATDVGLKIGLKIDIDKDVTLAAHLAGTDNNRVDIVGGGSLNLGSDADGNLIMSGTYDVTSGKVDYKLPVLPMVKTFDISNTSMVYWEGSEPTNPTIAIRATEDVKATVSDEQGSRIVRFVVGININGTLDALQMTFDCDSPDDGAISSDIASLDAEERSKTALLLLIAQTYVGPGNNSSVGLGTANAALNSMLNRQLDSMLGNMKGTKINVGIDTYSTDAGSTLTDYSVKFSQNLFNDRFRATIGGKVTSGNEPGQTAGARLGDMSLEWLIKKDGSHYVKLFRRTNYESVLEGELIETGVSYVQERTGYKFRTLFIPTNKKRQQRLEALIKEMQEKEAREAEKEEAEKEEAEKEEASKKEAEKDKKDDSR